MAYDAEGHRTQLREVTAGVLTRTRDLRYQGDAIVEEKVTDPAHPSGAVVRSYTVTDAGQVVSMTIPAGEPGAGTYLPTWNGHGDALALWRQETNGTLTLANSYTYGTWGSPATATHNGIADLGFRFLYVGSGDVQWDDFSGAGLAYMHARHYSPLTGRFLQPDPSAAEANLYAYAEGSPVSRVDPSGTEHEKLTRAVNIVCSHLGNKGRCFTVKKWADWAKAETIRLFRTNRDRVPANAFKHCIWAGGCALELGGRFAKEITDAHENKINGYYIDRPSRRATNPSPAWWREELRLRSMDLHNNAMGIELASRVPFSATHSSYHGYFMDGPARRLISRACMNALRQGDLRYLEGRYP